MTTLIAAYNSEGCIGRCDARCHKATSPDCECICGGLNHGVGHKQAVENTQRWAETMIQAYTKRHNLENPRFEINEEAMQLTLL